MPWNFQKFQSASNLNLSRIVRRVQKRASLLRRARGRFAHVSQSVRQRTADIVCVCSNQFVCASNERLIARHTEHRFGAPLKYRPALKVACLVVEDNLHLGRDDGRHRSCDTVRRVFKRISLAASNAALDCLMLTSPVDGVPSNASGNVKRWQILRGSARTEYGWCLLIVVSAEDYAYANYRNHTQTRPSQSIY